MSIEDAIKIQVKQAIEAGLAAPAGPRLLKAPQAAAYLGVSVRHLRELVADGQLQRLEVGGPKFDVRDLDAFIEARKRACC